MEKKQGKQTTKRRLKGEQKVYGDLFKLLVTNCQKNFGTEIAPRLLPVEHCHFFHSFDSNGRKMTRCSSIAGHYHECKMVEENGSLKLEVGPAVWNVDVERRVLNNVIGGDNHKHDSEYISSEEVTVRKISAESAKMMNTIETLGLGTVSTGLING